MPERTLEFFNGMIPLLDSLISSWREHVEAIHCMEVSTMNYARDHTETLRDIQGERWRLSSVEDELIMLLQPHGLMFDATDPANPRIFVNIPTPVRGGKATENLPHCWWFGKETFVPWRGTIVSPTYGDRKRKALQQ